MNPKFGSFAEELYLIKLAEEGKEPADKPGADKWAPYRDALKHLVTYAVGFGLGDMAGIQIADRVTPEMIAKIPPQARQYLPSVLGIVSGMGATLGAMALAPRKKKEEDESVRQDK
jgi:hypothetical protein